MKYILFILLLTTTTLSAQYSNISLQDQLRLEIERRDPYTSVLLSGTKADVSQLADASKVKYLQRSLSAIPVERYAAFSGNPYYMEEFRGATLRDLTGTTFPLSSVNYNAHSGRLEFKSNGNWVEINPGYFPNAVFAGEDGATRLLVYGMLPDHKAFYSELIFRGKRFRAALHKKVFTFDNETYDASPITTRFAPKDLFYVEKSGRWQPVAMKNKAIAAALGHPKQLMAFVREHKLKVNQREDLIKIIEYADSL